MGYNLFYKINSETALHVLSVAYIPDPSQFMYSDERIVSGSSLFYLGGGSMSNSSSGFPSYDGSNAVSVAQSVQATYVNNEDSTSIFAQSIISEYDSARGNATQFELTSGDVIYLCTSSGAHTGVEISFSIDSDYNRPTMQIQFNSDLTDYSGFFSCSVGLISSIAPTTRFFFFSDGSSFGIAYLAYVYGNYRNTNYNYVVNSFAYLYYKNNPYRSPFLSFLSDKKYIYGASGSDDNDSTGSGYSGGGGSYDFPSSDIDPDDDIDSSASGASPAIAAGLVNPYYVTSSQIAALGNFLWSDSFYDSIAKTFSNPMDCIISLASFPIASSSMSLGSSESVRVGNTTSSSTGTRLISEFVTIDCGSVSVPEIWGSYLDYAQTKLYIYLPYLGIEELPLCECMGGSVACKLRINLLTGALVACLTLTSGTYVTGSARVQPIYFSTTCKSDIPVSGATTGALAGAFQLLGGAVSTVAGIASGAAPLAVSGLASAAQGVATMQSQNSQISGAVGAAGGQMAHKTPFLIFDRPVQSVPANLASVAGYQSNSGTTLSRCSGYVICDTINLDGLALTRSELEEVEQICTSGVYIS